MAIEITADYTCSRINVEVIAVSYRRHSDTDIFISKEISVRGPVSIGCALGDRDHRRDIHYARFLSCLFAALAYAAAPDWSVYPRICIIRKLLWSLDRGISRSHDGRSRGAARSSESMLNGGKESENAAPGDLTERRYAHMDRRIWKRWR